MPKVLQNLSWEKGKDLHYKGGWNPGSKTAVVGRKKES